MVNHITRLMLTVLVLTLCWGGTARVGAQTELKPRPASSYLHRPFVALRIALRMTDEVSGPHGPHFTDRVVHATVFDRSAIDRLVRTINSVHTLREMELPCTGGNGSPGPDWLSFVRPDGSVMHVFDLGMCGGMAVNGTRWMNDPHGAVLAQVVHLVAGRG